MKAGFKICGTGFRCPVKNGRVVVVVDGPGIALAIGKSSGNRGNIVDSTAHLTPRQAKKIGAVLMMAAAGDMKAAAGGKA